MGGGFDAIDAGQGRRELRARHATCGAAPHAAPWVRLTVTEQRAHLVRVRIKVRARARARVRVRVIGLGLGSVVRVRLSGRVEQRAHRRRVLSLHLQAVQQLE